MPYHTLGRRTPQMWATARVLLVCTCLASVLAVTQIYDETLWTKALWTQRWKLDSKIFTSNPTEENPGLVVAYPDIRDAVMNSLDGPGPRQAKQSGRPDVFDAEALDDQELLEPASQAVRCTVCNTLVTRVWQRLVVDLLKGVISAPTASHFLPKYLTEACEKEVIGLLHRTVIYRMEVDNDAHSMTFFVLRKRKAGTTPTQSERQAVHMACKDILTSSKGELVELLNRQLQQFKSDLNTLLAKHGLSTIPDDLGPHAGQLQQQHAAAAAQAMQADEDAAKGALGLSAGADGAANPAGVVAVVPEGAVGAAGGAAVDAAAGGGAVAGMTTADAAAAAAGLGAGAAAGGLAVAGEAAGGAAGAALGGAGGVGRGADGRGGPEVDGLVDKLLKGLATQLKREGILVHFESGGAGADKKLGGGQGEDDDDEYLDPEEEEENDGADCLDLHPQCEQWANEGECDANPNYMLGTGKLKGHCRKACGLCSPQAVTAQDVLESHPVLAKEVQTLSNNMMQVVKSVGCTSSQACLTGTTGLSVDGTMVAAKVAVEMQPSSGFVLGRPSWGLPQVVETPESSALAKKLQQEMEKGGAPKDSREELQLDVESKLFPELGGRVLHLRTEFFTYEFLYKGHTRHFHEDAKGTVTEDWSLGTFQRESVTVEASAAAGGGPAALHPRDLLPDVVKMAEQSWPYVKQVYANGNVCVLGGGRRAVRRTEVRIACSPDNKLHFLVREPDFCQYIFVIYSPAMCTLPHYKPRNEPTTVAE